MESVTKRASRTITVGVQKGGVGKTTTVCSLAYVMTKLRKQKVLVVDFDPQGNATEMLTQKFTNFFHGKSVMDAIINKDAASCIYEIDSKLHVMPADETLSFLPQYLYTKRAHSIDTALWELLDQVTGQYDYILIDTPPNLGENTQNALMASEYSIVMLQPAYGCYRALNPYMNLMKTLRDRPEDGNTDLKLLGILPCIVDMRVAINIDVCNTVREIYGKYVFKTNIRRLSKFEEFASFGMQRNNMKDREALRLYDALYDEIVDRTENGLDPELPEIPILDEV